MFSKHFCDQPGPKVKSNLCDCLCSTKACIWVSCQPKLIPFRQSSRKFPSNTKLLSYVLANKVWCFVPKDTPQTVFTYKRVTHPMNFALRGLTSFQISHLIPMQILFPSPNGSVANWCRWAFASGVNREGSNFIGSGKRDGSREKASAGIITAVSLGRIDPFGSR